MNSKYQQRFSDYERVVDFNLVLMTLMFRVIIDTNDCIIVIIIIIIV